MISRGGQCVRDVGSIAPTLVASYYCKSTYASHPTPYVVEYGDKADRKSVGTQDEAKEPLCIQSV